jgi:DNA-binding NarL/FixJ family response regulator
VNVPEAPIPPDGVPPQAISVLLVDDHPLWRETLRKVLEKKGVAVVVEEASDGAEALDKAAAVQPEVVVMDLELPGIDGIETTRQLIEVLRDVKVLVLSGSSERKSVVDAVRAGAAGYLLKTSGATEITDAIGRVARGEMVFPPALAEVVLNELRRDPGTAVSGVRIREVSLRREGEYWSLAFTGEVFRLKDAKGLHYLAYLLSRPGKEAHVQDLLTTLEGTAAPSAEATREDALSELDDLGDAGPMLDARAKAEFKRRLQDLSEELEEAERWSDSERAARAREEIEAITDQLTAAVGLGGRDRPAASHAERRRVRVTKSIRTAIKRIASVEPQLGEHLQASVKTGHFCSYAPGTETSIRWSIEP